MGVDVTKKEERLSKNAALHAAAGGFAGACARFAVGPLDVVKIRMQVQLEPIKRGLNSKYTGLGQALRTIVQEEGVRVSFDT
jgi:hypothetical protein